MNINEITFREYLNEGKMSLTFKIKLSKEYNIKRSIHVSSARGESNKVPRDASLSIKRYNLLFSKISVPTNSKFAIIWGTDKNIYYNGIVAMENNGSITIVTAIIGQEIKKDALFKDIPLRFDIGLISWNEALKF